jgi:hypothetical protein
MFWQIQDMGVTLRLRTNTGLRQCGHRCRKARRRKGVTQEVAPATLGFFEYRADRMGT